MTLKLQNVKLDNLLHFHHVAALRSLGGASKSLGISPPAVTHSLKKLEESIGTVLCQRGKGGFRLTAAGERLFAKTQAIFQSLESFAHELEDPQQFAGTLSIAMIDNLDNSRAQSAIDAVVQAFPRIKIAITVANTEEIIHGVRRGEFDVGFGIFHEREGRLEFMEIGQSSLRYFISDKHPLWSKTSIEKDDLKGHRVVWVENKKRNPAELDSEIFVPHRGYKMTVAGYANHLDGALALLNSGFAVVPIPPSYIAKLRDRDHIRELKIKTNAPLFSEELVFDPKRPKSPPLQTLIDRLKPLN